MPPHAKPAAAPAAAHAAHPSGVKKKRKNKKRSAAQGAADAPAAPAAPSAAPRPPPAAHPPAPPPTQRPAQALPQRSGGASSSSSRGKGKRGAPSVLQRMREQLQGGHFRALNEQLYTTEGSEALNLMRGDPALYAQYHEGAHLGLETRHPRAAHRAHESMRDGSAFHTRRSRFLSPPPRAQAFAGRPSRGRSSP
jgi:hypothetical protein